MENEKVIKPDHNKRVFDMIRLLRKNGKMKAREIVDALGVKTTRSVSNYKLCIEKLGYKVKTTYGYYGGYEIEEALLSPEELDLIKKILGKDKYYLYKKIKEVNDKI